MGEYRILNRIVLAGIFITFLSAAVFAQTEQNILIKYCVATPDTECFNPVAGAVDTVGRDVAELGGGYRFCLPVESVGVGSEPIQVVIVIDKSTSMRRNDPDNMRVEAARIFVDSLRAKAQKSFVGSAIFYDTLLIDLSLSPVQLNDANAYDNLISSFENARNDPNATSLGGTYQGIGVSSGLDMLLSLREASPGKKQHIIMITDDGWYVEEDITPEEVLGQYRPQFPDTAFPQIHTVVLTQSGSADLNGLENIQMIADSSGGLYIKDATPATIVPKLLQILDTLTQKVPNTLESMSVTNLTNGEERTNTTITSVLNNDSTIVQYQATMANLPLEFGDNTVAVKRMVKKAGNDQPIEEIDTVSIFRTDAWTTSVNENSDEYIYYCTDDSTKISINVTPPMKFINEPFNVQSTILMKEKLDLDSVDVRVFTKSSDSDPSSVAVFHLDGNLNNTISDNSGNGANASFTTTGMLFGNGAMNAGSFTTEIGELSGDFSFDAWMFPTSGTTPAELFNVNGFVVGINEERNLYVANGGMLLLTSQAVLGTDAWSHVAISRVSGSIVLSINGLSVTGLVEFSGVLSGNISVSCPANTVIDEVRISAVSRLNAEPFGTAIQFEIPSVQNITWVRGGAETTGEVLTLPPGDWNNGSTSFQFKSPVHGKLLINMRHKGTTLATTWSKNGNPVFAAADIEGPYITRALITPGAINSTEDKMQIFFSEPVQCDSLKKSTDPSESFKLFQFTGGTPAELGAVFNKARYEKEGCPDQRISEVTVCIKKEATSLITALQDSIKLYGAAVDTFGNYPDTTRFAYIEGINSLAVTVAPDTLLTNIPFTTEATLVTRNKTPMENVDVRVFTKSPDTDNGTTAVYHLNNDLINSTNGKSGTSAGVEYTMDNMLFGEGALSGGSFQTTIANLSADFAVETWIRPAATSSESVIFSAGDFTFGINNELKPYVSEGSTTLSVSEYSLDSVWTHVSVSRMSGQVILFINGLRASQFAEYTGTLSGAATISCPTNAILDEMRISNTHRQVGNTPAETMRFDVPSVQNITWNYNGGNLPQPVLTLHGEEWGDGQVSFTFSCAVGGELVVNLQDKGATASTIRSVNSNRVFCAADLQGPFITQAIFTPGPINSFEDTLKVYFSEPVICSSLKSQTDLAQTFKVFEFIPDQNGKIIPTEKDSVFMKGHFASMECPEKRITETTVLVRTRNVGGIVPLLDSIKLYGTVIDTFGNYPDTTRFGTIVYGPGSGIEIAALPSENELNPMLIPSGVANRWNISEPVGKVVVIQTRAPLVLFDTAMINGVPVPNYSQKTVVYDGVGNIVATDLIIQATPHSDRMYYIFWNGRNRSSRKVQTGAYLLKSWVRYRNQPEKFVPLKTKFSIKWIHQ